MKPRDVRMAALLVVAVPVFAGAQAQTAVNGSKAPADTSRRAEATEIWTDHLKLTTYPNQAAIAPGRRVSLIVEIEPSERMHVYAPGADGYRVITLTMATQPFLRLAPVQYPVSEVYVFEPLNERIPVYQKPFKLIQDVTLEKPPQVVSRGKPVLTLTGTLDYQACDDKVCFNPVSIPLSWTLTLQPDATQRPGRAPTPR